MRLRAIPIKVETREIDYVACSKQTFLLKNGTFFSYAQNVHTAFKDLLFTVNVFKSARNSTCVGIYS